MGKQKANFKIEFDIGTIKHLGLQMYATLPPVIGELVANAWDADAEHVNITIPKTAFKEDSKIVIDDDGEGMSDKDVRTAYLIVGRDRRKDKGDKPTRKHRRRVMGHKGIGKFSAFGIAGAATGDSLCADSIWDVQAVAVDSVTQARATLTEGMSVRVSSDNIINSCP